MLATLRKHSRSIFIYVLFGLLILTFILTFGPPSAARRGMRGAQSGCGTATPAAATVNGGDVAESSWRWAVMIASQGSPSSQRAKREQVREKILDGLIVRELLAQRAEDMGLRISDEEVRQRLTAGDWYFLGSKASAQGRFFVQDSPEDPPHFSARALDAFAKQGDLGSVDRLVEEQKKELMAAKVRELVLASVRVSPEEVQAQYQVENTKADLDYVTFSVAQARAALELQPADIDAYLKAHEADLKAQFDKEADRWKGRDKEVRVRDLYVKSERPAPPAPAEGDKDKAPPTPPAAPPPAADPARAKADAALARIKKGEDFAAVVKSVAPAAPRGGDLGWRPLRGLRLGKPVADAVEKLDKGATTDVVEVPDGYHIVQLVDKREGDLAFDQVKRDLAEDGVRDEKAKSAAKAEADKALAAVKEGKPLDKQFPADADAKTPGPKLQHAVGVARVGGFVQGLGSAPDVIKAVFDELSIGDVAPKVYEVGGDYVVVKLIKRDAPDMEKFQTEKTKLASEMAQSKGQIELGELAASQCRRAKEAGQISYDPMLVEYSETEGKQKTAYSPCSTLPLR